MKQWKYSARSNVRTGVSKNLILKGKSGIILFEFQTYMKKV